MLEVTAGVLVVVVETTTEVLVVTATALVEAEADEAAVEAPAGTLKVTPTDWQRAWAPVSVFWKSVAEQAD